jgi:ParB-like chromosome segregation protein Spo0J
MTDPVKIGFERVIAVLPLAALLLLKTVPEAIRLSNKYKQIARSVGELGLI